MDLTTIILLVAFLIIGFLLGKFLAELKISASRKDAVERSRYVLTGKVWEQVAPYLPNFKHNPSDIRFLGSPVDFVVFDADPVYTAFTNNSALDIDPADMAKIIGIVKIASLDYVPFLDNSAACIYNIGLPLENETMYACLVSRNTPTYLVNGLSLILGLIGE